MEGAAEKVENIPQKGRNVHITLKFIRHGLRAPSGELTDYGREATRQKAQQGKKLLH